ncbi:MAG: ccmE, partial [Acidimicrobiia bacterium]|nr:ccmE [Acidimicrobiia bacterium]
ALPEGVNLTPRTSGPATPRRRRKRRNIALLTAVAFAASFLLFEFLTNSTEYYCNVDEVGVKAGCSGTASLRLQGTVVPGSVQQANGVLNFGLEFNHKTIQVHHQGDPQALFQPGIAVVLVGHLVDGTTFDSHEIMVKHSEKYEKEHPDRVSTPTTVA